MNYYSMDIGEGIIVSSCCKYSLHLVSKLIVIQASTSTFSFSDHTTVSLRPVHRSLLRLLPNPSVKFIDILWTLIILPISILHNNFPCMHSPSYSSILSRCIHVQVSTTIFKITLAHIQVPITFFLHVHIKCQCPEAISRCVYYYNLYP